MKPEDVYVDEMDPTRMLVAGKPVQGGRKCRVYWRDTLDETLAEAEFGGFVVIPNRLLDGSVPPPVGFCRLS